jgi:hypothetical protein
MFFYMRITIEQEYVYVCILIRIYLPTHGPFDPSIFFQAQPFAIQVCSPFVSKKTEQKMSTKAIKILEVIETMPPCYKIALVQHDDSLVRINESLSKSKVLLLCQLHNVSMPNHPDFLLPFSNKIVRVAVTGRQGQCEDDEPMDRPDTLYNVNLIF